MTTYMMLALFAGAGAGLFQNSFILFIGAACLMAWITIGYAIGDLTLLNVLAAILIFNFSTAMSLALGFFGNFPEE